MRQLWFRAAIERSRLLPPICPACLDVGVRPLDVPSRQPGSDPGVTAYYCDDCADRLEQRATRLMARRASQGVLGIGAATSAALVLGGARVPLQVLLTLLAATFPLVIAAWPGAVQAQPALLHLASDAVRHHWLARRKDFLQRLGADVAIEHAPVPRRRIIWDLLPALAALAWLSTLHWFGRAELRVLHSGDQDAVVLIDHRRRQTIAPTRTEHAYAAHAVSTLAGRRTLGIVGEEGTLLVDVTATLWPGRDYVLGTLPAGRCLFLERQEYGEEGSARDLVALPGAGPLWELPVNVDQWFAPLSPRPSLPTSGGIRTAVRLLPCR